jgi:acyl-CoA synthetase (AMP-forming)/AMP-acid ligase II
MGLIEGVLQPAFSGSPAYLMSPGAFLQRPARWLKALSRYRGTRSGGPNFAYDLAVSRVDAAERAALDLSAWDAAYNGAEPVRGDTMAAFSAAYRQAGFRPSAFRPCYGLAESTLLVSSGRWDESGATTGAVSCGTPAYGTHVVIADPVSGVPCGDGELGEIRVAGPGVTSGYWNDAEETRRVFDTMPGADRRWLRTGDLGVRRNGQLHVTGRLKDVLIVRGAKHFPQDVERTAEGLHPAIRRGTVTAVAVASGVRGDQVVLIAEIDPRSLPAQPASDLMARMRQAVADAHGIRLHAVALVPPGVVPKTTSGKPRRYLCREAWVEGTLQPIAEWSDPGRAAPRVGV